MAEIPLTRRGPDNGGNYEFSWSDEMLQVHLISDVGKRREHNEDSCLMCIPDDKAVEGQRGRLFSVADGMGGASAGEHASRLALERLSEKYFTSEEEVTLPVLLERAMEHANLSVFEEAESTPEYYGMGTTVCCVAIRDNGAYIASVGDSRVYLERPNVGLVQLTDDHSLVAEQVRGGIITEEEARDHSLKNLITRAVGIKEDVEIDLFSLTLEEGDTLLLCSDGLSNMLDDNEIGDGLRLDTPEHVSRILVGAALEAGGPDNITAAVIRVVGALKESPLEEGGVEIACPSQPAGWKARLKRWFG